jgi:soluble lytic murein transglycosylase-like protein
VSLPRLAILAGTVLTATLVPALAAEPAHAQTTTQTTTKTTTRAAAPSAARATPWPGHPDRSIVRHVVRPGETAAALAVRYHAWTAELLRLNRLGPAGTVYRGQVLRIPVVVSAARRASGPSAPGVGKKHPGRGPKRAAHPPLLMHSTTPTTRKWLHADLTRSQVRDLIVRMARHYDVPPRLALAVAWQESGWQQRRVSSTGAIGVMQVMPDTGRWMRWYAGRPLRLRDTHDNIRAGVLTLKVLRAWTKYDNNAIGAYYQGLGALREHGYFRDTKHYVVAVRAHQRRLIHTGSPT